MGQAQSGESHNPFGMSAIAQKSNFPKEELEDIRKEFMKLAAKSPEVGDAVIKKEQFGEALKAAGVQPSNEAFANALYAQFDQNGDGVINFVEFCAGLAVLLKGTPMEKYQLCFEIYDVEKTGTINKKEMLQVFKAMNLALDCAADGGSRKSYSEAELQSFVDDVFKKGEEKAANKDEQLSFNEFLRAVKAYPQLVDFK